MNLPGALRKLTSNWVYVPPYGLFDDEDVGALVMRLDSDGRAGAAEADY